jgi:hypothetical protein
MSITVLSDQVMQVNIVDVSISVKQNIVLIADLHSIELKSVEGRRKEPLSRVHAKPE